MPIFITIYCSDTESFSDRRKEAWGQRKPSVNKRPVQTTQAGFTTQIHPFTNDSDGMLCCVRDISSNP